jgi:hypothetical protein
LNRRSLDSRYALPRDDRQWWLLGGHLFLFAFHAHLLQFAFLGLNLRLDLLVHLLGRFFQFGESWTLR